MSSSPPFVTRRNMSRRPLNPSVDRRYSLRSGLSLTTALPTERVNSSIELRLSLPWIRVIHRTNRGFRKSGGGVMEAFYDGYNTLQCNDWDFLAKLDGDLSFAPDYFEKCFEYFRRNLDLGIGGGEIHHNISGKLKREENPRFHVRGATKIYSRTCWEGIGGLWPAPG